MTPNTKRLLNLAQKLGVDSLLLRVSTLPGLRPLINRIAWNRQSLAHCDGIYHRFMKRIDRHGIALASKSILEIGAGNSIGIGYFFARHGISRWTASDPIMKFGGNTRFARDEHELSRKILLPDHPDLFESIRIEDNKILFESIFRFIKLDATVFMSNLEGQFDLIFSNSVFEHLTEDGLEATLANCRRYLKPNGVMIHGIDLKDHINPLNPLGFYKYSDKKWRSLTSGSIFYVNRLRHTDYMKIFQEHGFHIMECEPYLPLPLPTRIHPDIRNRYGDDEIRYGEVFITARNGDR